MKTKLRNLSVLFLLLGLIVSCEKEVSLTGIQLDKVTAEVMVGSTLNLSVIYDPLNATNKNVTWESTNTSVATVTDGIVTGVAIGTATIKVISQENSLLQASCEVTVIPSNGQQINVSGDITSDTKWYANARYFLSGFVYVKNNATLTIEAGTIIKGVSGTKGTLIIERGSKIIAAGTETKPIVFTSDKPKGQRGYGDWGGLVLCGKAPTNKHDNGTGVGIAEGGIGSQYGGSDPNDNSGVLQYVRIEFSGIPLTATANSEINGLTLYSVGKGTTIDHIQVSYCGDDSYEWFGGNVNCKYLVAFRGWDDDFDTDNGYSGKVQFFLSLRDPASADQSQSNGFESDNDADGSTLTPFTSAIFVNGSIFGPRVTPETSVNSLYRHAIQLRRGTRLSIYNTVFAGWPHGLYIDGQKGDSPAQAAANVIQIENCVLAGMGNNFVTTYMSDAEAWFKDAIRNNQVLDTNDELQIANPFNLTAPNFLPSAGSPLLSGASFTNTRLTDSFFTQVTYRGAFGNTNWTANWCNFDPQNTDY
ncbi:MAG: Ig-like domain-containing protein [Bacteroidales bacterium]|nr:Ig-like domain-containing protein [Bacteroidales bacterium]